ncbi:hypothetical protein EDC04DRAFT_721177 [Pisolithus marmoratus]|nr:hypothetical protein EDC04DRAFT_721177 [Pisolithus marmoratus]
MLLNLQKFFKGLTSGRVIPIRRKCPQKTSESHPSPPTTDSPIKNVSCTKSRLSKAGDVIQLVSPLVQGTAGAIPVAGSPLKAAVDGLLYIIQIIDTKNRNKADLDKLASRLQQLFDILLQQPEPLDEKEAKRREALTKRLNDTSLNLMAMQGCRGFKFAYNSVTKDIAGYIADVDRVVLDYLLGNQVRTLSRVELLLASPRGCAILIDAMGHEHNVALEYCTSLRQLEKMLEVVLTSQRRGASVQRRYLESGKFDLCIDDGQRVVQLSSGSNEWPNIEAGTKIVMRVVFEQAKFFTPAHYTCHLCGTPNNLSPPFGFEGWLTDGSVDCHACKGRFQISLPSGRRGATRSDVGNDLLDTETRHCIRNFVTQIVCISLLYYHHFLTS